MPKSFYETSKRANESKPFRFFWTADASLLPSSAIEKLQIEPSGEKVKLVGFDESENIADAYTLQIIFLGKRLTGDFCAIDDEIGTLGRDVLNEFSIIFDGKNLMWKEQA